MTEKIKSGRQLNIPRKVRDVQKSNTIELEVINGSVVMRPVSGVGGAWRSYARGCKAMREVRDRVWGEVALAKGREEAEVHKSG